jgi:hypothetical protein
MCNREQEVLDAVQSGRLDTLSDHFKECQDCNDLALIAGFFQTEGETAYAEITHEHHLPSASFLWWKSKLRARREAEHQVLQPVRIAEKIAIGGGALVAGALGWFFWPTAGIASIESGIGSAVQMLVGSTLVMGTAAALISLAGLAAYAVFAKE